MNKEIITLGRQFGSGGKLIGSELAKKLGVKFYDKELLLAASKESGISKEFFENADESQKGSFMQAVSMGFNVQTAVFPVLDYLSNESLFNVMAKVIREIVAKESCVIVGRCADYILREDKPLRVFITCDMDERIRRVAKDSSVSEKEAEKMIQKADKVRSSYYNYYTDQVWGDSRYYDISLNSNLAGIDKTVDMLNEVAKIYFRK